MLMYLWCYCLTAEMFQVLYQALQWRSLGKGPPRSPRPRTVRPQLRSLGLQKSPKTWVTRCHKCQWWAQEFFWAYGEVLLQLLDFFFSKFIFFDSWTMFLNRFWTSLTVLITIGLMLFTFLVILSHTWCHFWFPLSWLKLLINTPFSMLYSSNRHKFSEGR